MQNIKKVLIFLLVLMITIISAWFILKKYYLLELVYSGIEERIGAQIENDFKFTLENFKINWISKQIQLSGFNLLLYHQSDTVGYYRGDIEILVYGWINLFFDEQKHIKNIELRAVQLYYAFDYPLKMKEKFSIEGLKVDIMGASAQGSLILADRHIERSGRLATNFDLSADLNYKSTEVLKVDQIIQQLTTLNLSQFHFYLEEGFYQMMIEEIDLYDHNDVVLKNINVNPIDSQKSFAAKKKVATDYISLAIDSIQLVDLDRQQPGRFISDQIQVYHPRVDVYKDRNFPDSKAFKAVLTDLLRDLETPVYIREMGLNNMFIKYSELANGADSPGELFFSEANARISNITNIKDSVLISDKMVIEAEAKFYGVAKINTSMEYALLSKFGHFNISGSLSPFEIRKVNAIVSRLVPVSIESGQLDNLRFNFWGTNKHATGEMWFEYRDLKFDLLEVKYWNSNFTQNIISVIGNKWILNSNPNKMGKFTVGEINQERDTTKAMFHYWWVSLRSGFLSSIGVTSAKKKINFSTGGKTTFRDKIGLGKK